MIYDGYLVKINGVVVPYIKQYKIGRGKLWKNSNRNMAGSVRASLIGIFPKILMQIGFTTQDEMSMLTELLDSDFFEVEWFDVRTKTTNKAMYYAGDYEIDLYLKHRGLYSPFNVNLIPVERRAY